ncbi:MAG: hypothetical protein JXB07_19045 [Anaerolineae bacterium]|nr:hypothetical protein [Anaerolineae bacterium]
MTGETCKCAVIGCGEVGLYRVVDLPGRVYCLAHFKGTAKKLAMIRRAERAIARRNEAEDNSPARQPAGY